MLAMRIVLAFAALVLAAGETRAQEAPPIEARPASQAAPEIPPMAGDPASYYPERAKRMDQGGKALLSCMADTQGLLTDCRLITETPGGWGFGDAALKMAKDGALRRTSPRGIAERIVFATPFSPPSGKPLSLPKRKVSVLLPQRLIGEPPSPPASVTRGETIVSFPFAFNRTAVLDEDVTSRSRWLKGVLVPAGSPGFYTGTLKLQRPAVTGEVWCFVPLPIEDALGARCLAVLGKEAIVLPPGNPYVLNGFVAKRGALIPATVPHFEEKAVAIPGNLSLEYRFQGWTPAYAEVQELAGGWPFILRPLPRQADGRALLQTLAGDFWLSPVAGAPDRAAISPAAP